MTRIKNMDKQIGQNLKSIRKARRLTQKALGDLLGVSAQQIQKYENGQNRLAASTLYILCEKLEISFDDVIGQSVDFYSSALPPSIKTNTLDEDTKIILNQLSQMGSDKQRRHIREIVCKMAQWS